MTLIRFFAAAVLTLGLFAQTSWAQDRVPAQQPEGDRTERQAPMRRVHNMNIRFSPMAALVGIIDANFDYGLTPNITIGPKVTYINLSAFNVAVKGTSLGAEGRYHFTEAFDDGGYLTLVLATINIEASARSKTTGLTASANGSGLNYGVGVGYHWFWDSFNLNIGASVGGTSAGKIEVKDSTGSTVESTTANFSTGLDFKIGFTF